MRGINRGAWATGRALDIGDRAEFAAFEAIEEAVGRKEAIIALVFCDDAGGVASNFDDGDAVQFSREGNDEMGPASGNGWAELQDGALSR